MSKPDTTSVRLEAETARLARIAASAARESLVRWLSAAVRQRLDRENRLPTRFKIREVSVTFDDFLGSPRESDSLRRR